MTILAPRPGRAKKLRFVSWFNSQCPIGSDVVLAVDGATAFARVSSTAVLTTKGSVVARFTLGDRSRTIPIEEGVVKPLIFN